jgi:AraC family transcriptional regulator
VLAAVRAIPQDAGVMHELKRGSAIDPESLAGDPQSAAPRSRLRLGALTARILGAPGEPPAELHLDEVRVLAPATFARMAFDGAAEPEIVRAPHVCIVPPGQRLHVRMDAGSEGILVSFDTLLCEERAIRVQGRPARVTTARAAIDPVLRDGLESIAGEMRTGRARDADGTDSRCDELALHLASAYGSSEPPSNCAGLARPRLERVLALIEQNLAEALPVSELAQAVHLSPFHFSRMFRVSTGRSPHEWIMLKRMARAKALLAASHLSLPEVARASGYRTHSHFSGMFHAVVGMTPGQYRARHG